MSKPESISPPLTLAHCESLKSDVGDTYRLIRGRKLLRIDLELTTKSYFNYFLISL